MFSIYRLDHELQLALHRAVRALHTFPMAIPRTLTPSCITWSYSANRPLNRTWYLNNHKLHLVLMQVDNQHHQTMWGCQATGLLILLSAIDPLRPSDDFGFDIYLQVVNTVGHHLSHGCDHCTDWSITSLHTLKNNNENKTKNKENTTALDHWMC